MKTLKLIITVLLMTVAFHSSAASDNGNFEPMFGQASGWDNFEYTYVSPYMLKSLRQSNTRQNFIPGLDISKIDMIEMVTTPWHGKEERINSLVNKVAKLPGMHLLMSGQKNNQSAECFGMPVSRNSDQLKQVLIIKRSSWNSRLAVIYLIGDISVEQLYKLID